MKVTYVDHMGSDLSVVNAARVSFSKKCEEFQQKDAKLLHYLANHEHTSPFRHPTITLHVKAPIFIARQLGKHQVGLSWNEVSRRYVDSEPELYAPEVWRQKSEDKKQGSSDEPIEAFRLLGFKWESTHEAYQRLEEHALTLYKDLVEADVCPEQARMVLPQSMYTEWYWTGSLLAFYHAYRLRSDPHAQKEVQDVAMQIKETIEPLYPVSWKALEDAGRS